MHHLEPTYLSYIYDRLLKLDGLQKNKYVYYLAKRDELLVVTLKIFTKLKNLKNHQLGEITAKFKKKVKLIINMLKSN